MLSSYSVEILNSSMISKFLQNFKKPKAKKGAQFQSIISYAILGIAVGLGFNAIKPFFGYARSSVSNARSAIDSQVCKKGQDRSCDKQPSVQTHQE